MPCRSSTFGKVVRDEIAQYYQQEEHVDDKQFIHKFILFVLRVSRGLSLFAKRVFRRFHLHLRNVIKIIFFP